MYFAVVGTVVGLGYRYLEARNLSLLLNGVDYSGGNRVDFVESFVGMRIVRWANNLCVLVRC